jgi:lysozyme family protein
MADFEKALSLVLRKEGLYGDDLDDPGGETYKGVARRHNPKWPGWVPIDLAKLKPNFPRGLEDDKELQNLVVILYRKTYWDKVMGDKFCHQAVVESVFDFAVNAGPRTSIKLAQIAVGTEPDGVLGPKTLQALNSTEERFFLLVFAIAKIARYVRVCKKRPKSRKYFFGWVIRTLEAL